jgi:pimeloyl-ACP methyl ester carboxylesterase
VIEYFDTDRGRFAVEITGPAEAPPVVLIAGLGDDHASWEPVLSYLAAQYRCVTFDNRGVGRSPITPQAMPAADLHVLEAGHMTFWEAPEQWGSAVTRWLDGHGPA